MGTCDYCGTWILFGGIRDQGYRYCGDNCHEAGTRMLALDQVPQETIDHLVDDLHQSECPLCGGPGPVDVHTSHRVWSALVLTSWNSRPQVCCSGCGTKAKVLDTIYCGLLGWWGFPWGLIVTPVQIGRNLFGLVGGPSPDSPSPQLEKIVRLQVVEGLQRAANQQRLAGAGVPGDATGNLEDVDDEECR